MIFKPSFRWRSVFVLMMGTFLFLTACDKPIEKEITVIGYWELMTAKQGTMYLNGHSYMGAKYDFKSDGQLVIENGGRKHTYEFTYEDTLIKVMGHEGTNYYSIDGIGPDTLILHSFAGSDTIKLHFKRLTH